MRTTKKGKILVGRRKSDEAAPAQERHDRAKELPLPEGKADRFLEVMGVSDRAGRVRPAMRRSTRRSTSSSSTWRRAATTRVCAAWAASCSLLDCGCGSSHLTLAAHHYLNDVLGVPARASWGWTSTRS